MAQIDETTVDTPSQGSDLSVEDAFFSDNNRKIPSKIEYHLKKTMNVDFNTGNQKLIK